MSERTKTELTVIVHADVAGSTALVQRDETLAHERMQGCFSRFSETIESYGGTAHEIRGDALVARFSRTSDAVCATVAFQIANRKFNEDLDDDMRPAIRIGIAMGEVVVADRTITGAGVVLAQRLEQLAEPGGVVVQASVKDTVPDRLPFVFAQLGEQRLKGFEQAVTAFAVSGSPGQAVPPPDYTPDNDPPNSAAVGATPPLPGRPSIAVLAFDNLSSDPEQDYFVDGIVEDIITELSRDPELFVIARNSTFAYKGTNTDIRTIAAELGVQYVLEGSVRRSGKRIRVTAQLIEGQSNRHVWAERYDRSIEDIFEVQDELTWTIRNNLVISVRDSDIERVMKRPTHSLDAYEHTTRAFGLIFRFNADNSAAAFREAEAALAIDPELSRAHTVLAWANLYAYFSGLHDNPAELLERGHAAALRGIETDRNDYWGHAALGFALLFKHEHSRALTAIDQAVALNPSSADAHAVRGLVLNYLDRPEEGLSEMELAIRHNPHHPDWYLSGLGRALFMLERYAEAIPHLERLVGAKGDLFTFRAQLVMTYMASGRRDDAIAELARLRELVPDMTLSAYREILPDSNPKRKDRAIELMRQAGMPE